MPSDNYDQALDRAAAACGIEPAFWDIFGNHHVTSPETKRAIVTALGYDASSLESLAAGWRQREEAQARRLVDPTLVASVNQQPVRVPVRTDAAQMDGEIRLESGETKRFHAHIDGERKIALPEGLPPGYHDLTVRVGEAQDTLRLILAPDVAYLPKFLEDGKKSAGIAITLYGLRSARNWGSGDFRDLRDFCDWAVKEARVSFIALNPLHAIYNRQPFNASPYLPNSIFFKNLIYIDIEALAEFRNSEEAQRQWNSEDVQREVQELRAAPFVEYERVQALKLRFLRLAFAEFRRDGGGQIPEDDLLFRFATYCALDEYLHAQNPDLWVWPDWPEPYRDPESPETRRFQEEHREEIRFHEYLQWRAHEQLMDARDHAKRAGLAIGLYHDLALATDRCGSDLWAHRPYYVQGCRVGSPPDDFSPAGQDWAFPPPNKDYHRETGYRLFVESIRRTCQYGGALRIDHVMRFFRLYWIPDGSTAAQGAYVRDYWEDLLRILALESVRNQVMVVGEDLGTVEPEIREKLAQFRILSYRLFFFERHPDGAFKTPLEYPRQALVSSTTHDLPTIAGFWIHEDIEARHKAGVLDDTGYRAQLDARKRDKQLMLDALHAASLLPQYVPRDASKIPELTGELHNAIIGFLAMTPAMLMLINQEDLSKETAQQNLPGTTWQHPNWSRKMQYAIEQLGTAPDARAFVEMFRHWLERTGRVT